MRKLPKAIAELDGGLFVPRQVAQLLERVLQDHEALARMQPEPAEPLAVLAELRQLLRMDGLRQPLPPARDLLALPDPKREQLARNLLRG